MSRLVMRKEELPARLTGGRAPLWWGMMLLVTIETIVFTSLFASYLYLRLGAVEWPPPGAELPDLTLPLINTGVLASSSVAVVIAARALKQGKQRQLKIWLGAGIVLEIVFLIIKIIMSRNFGQYWSMHAYGSIFWSISGLHTLHVLVAILMAGAAMVLAWRGYYSPERRVGMQAVSIYWQFVAIIWVPVLTVLYFLPRWLS
jgi:cytochrome c oxidase subunit III